MITATSYTSRIFLCLQHCCYTNYDMYYIDHGHYMIGYVDIDIKDNVYINSSEQVQSKRLRRHLRRSHSRCDCGREER